MRCPVEPAAAEAALAADDIVLTAPSGVEAFSALVGDTKDLRLRIVTIGPTTSTAVRDLGLTVSAESSEQSSDGLIAAIMALGPALA